MSTFLSGPRLGRAQVLAALLLLGFLGECVWLVAHEPPGSVAADELFRLEEGVEQWRGGAVAGISPSRRTPADAYPVARELYHGEHSPFWYLVESAPLALCGVAPDSVAGIWLSRIPYLLIGVLFGASVWYVSRRLYGNGGGYIALGLYCFSPAMIQASALWFVPPDIAGAWGSFGAVFTSIAVAHTLYAPREVVLWNWRRILLLGTSLMLAAGSDFRLTVVVPLLLVFMLYLAPVRRRSAVAILAASCATALGLLFSAYFFHPGAFWQGLAHAGLAEFHPGAFSMSGAYTQVIKEVAASGPVLVLLAPAALAIYAFWPRARYFGNTAPLIVAVLFLGLRVASPHESQSLFSLVGAVFLMVFVAGIASDLLETKAQETSRAVITGLLAANGAWNLLQLARLRA